MSAFTLADAREIVQRHGHDPDTWNGARRAMRLLCNPPHEDPQLRLFDELLEQVRGAVTELPAEVAM